MWCHVNLILVLNILCHVVRGLPRIDPLVETNVGLIRGLAAEDGDYSMFLGIPYAQVDERNPFGVSTPYPKFENVFEAYDESEMCPQRESNAINITGSLNCLGINIFVPNKANSQNKVPVMVYIYGGFFSRGHANINSIGPKYLVRHDVILVTFNYRVGPYGFMCLDVPEVPGNQGLKDQALAFNWVKNNIEAFGGDANKITVFGLSAGAHSLDFHLTYGDDNLFQNAILQSGSNMASTVIMDPDKSAATKIAEYMGMPTNSNTEALSFLATADPHLVINAAEQLDMYLKFKPCIEESFDGVEALIPKTWINIEKPKVKNKNIMLGFNEFERALDFDSPEKYIYNNIFRENLEVTFNFDNETLSEMEALTRHFYIGDENISEDVKIALVNFDSDYKYIHPMQRSIKKYLESPAKNVFYYMFSYVGERNAPENSHVVVGAKHSDESSYLFDQQKLRHIELTVNDQLMIDQMTTMWTNFAKYGKPTPETSELLRIEWTPVSKEAFYYLKIDTELTVEKRPMHKRMAFWNVFYMLNEKSQKFYEDIE